MLNGQNYPRLENQGLTALERLSLSTYSRKMIASGVVAAGDAVYADFGQTELDQKLLHVTKAALTAAGLGAAGLAASRFVGVALDAAAADGDEITVQWGYVAVVNVVAASEDDALHIDPATDGRMDTHDAGTDHPIGQYLGHALTDAASNVCSAYIIPQLPIHQWGPL